jgi:WD40 repeat protein
MKLRDGLCRVAIAIAIGGLPFASARSFAQDSVSMRSLGSHRLPVLAVAFSPDGKLLASGTGAFHEGRIVGEVKLWDPQSGELKRTITVAHGTVYSLAFSPRTGALAAASGDGVVTLWNAQTGSLEQTIQVQKEPVLRVAFSPDGAVLATSGTTIRLWDAASGKQRAVLTGHTEEVNGLAFSPNGEILASVSADKTLKLWRPQPGSLDLTLGGQAVALAAIAFAPDGRSLAFSGVDGGVTVLDVDTRTPKQTLSKHPNTVFSIAYSPDGRTIATATGDPLIASGMRFFTSGIPRIQPAKDPTPPKPAAATTSATESGPKATKSGTVYLYDAETGSLRANLTAVTDFVWAVAYSPTGELLGTGNADGTVRIWQLGAPSGRK